MLSAVEMGGPSAPAHQRRAAPAIRAHEAARRHRLAATSVAFVGMTAGSCSRFAWPGWPSGSSGSGCCSGSATGSAADTGSTSARCCWSPSATRRLRSSPIAIWPTPAPLGVVAAFPAIARGGTYRPAAIILRLPGRGRRLHVLSSHLGTGRDPGHPGVAFLLFFRLIAEIGPALRHPHHVPEPGGGRRLGFTRSGTTVHRGDRRGLSLVILTGCWARDPDQRLPGRGDQWRSP